MDLLQKSKIKIQELNVNLLGEKFYRFFLMRLLEIEHVTAQCVIQLIWNESFETDFFF